MGSLINPHLEFCEIINAFPVLEQRLEMLNFDISDMNDGETVYDYLKNHNYTEDEIDLLVKRLNSDLNYFLKKGDFPNMKLKPQSEVLGVSSEEFVEKEVELVEEYEEEE